MLGDEVLPRGTPKKNGRRYRDYVPQRENKGHAGASGLPRLPATELESAVLDQLRAILRAPNLLGEMLSQAIKLDRTLGEAKITVSMTWLYAIWDQLFPAEQSRIVKWLVEKVSVSPAGVSSFVITRCSGLPLVSGDCHSEPGREATTGIGVTVRGLRARIRR